MTEDERAASVIRAGVETPTKKWICPGCGEELLIEIPGRPLGVHMTFVIADEKGLSGPYDAWTHDKPRCVSGILKMIPSKAPEPPEPADEGETVPASLMGRKRKGVTPESEALTGAPASEREPEAVSN